MAPLPDFGSETLNSAHQLLESLPRSSPNGEWAIPSPFTACASGFSQAREQMDTPHGVLQKKPLTTARLLPRLTAPCLPLDAHTGVFKCKIGVQDARSEINALRGLSERLLPHQKLRIDANASLTPEGLSFWVEQLGPLVPLIDCLEQPLPKGQEAECLERASRTGIPIAFDESIATLEDLQHLNQRCPGSWTAVVKPALIGDLARFRHWRQQHPQRRIIYSSAMETAVGLNRCMILADSDPQPDVPLGVGIGPLFAPTPWLPAPFDDLPPHFTAEEPSSLLSRLRLLILD